MGPGCLTPLVPGQRKNASLILPLYLVTSNCKGHLWFSYIYYSTVEESETSVE